jgi:O-antigen/teichoic acid export membrane protein
LFENFLDKIPLLRIRGLLLMANVLKLGKISAAGGLQLFLGKILSTIIMAIGSIVLGILILEADYGLYAVALIPPATILLFQDWGIGTAIARCCAQYRAANNEGRLRKIVITGLTFEVASGIVLTLASLLLSNFLASTVLGKPESGFLVALVSVTILSSAISAATSMVFVGFEQMKYTSIIMICQAFVQSALAPLLVYLGFGALGAVLGYVFASIAGCVFSVIMLYFVIFKKLEKCETHDLSSAQVLRSLLNYGVPLGIGTILGGMLGQFYSFMMAAFSDNAIIGNYRIATNFATLLTFFIFPISTVLFPMFSKLDPVRERDTLKKVFSSSVKYSAFLLVPAILAMMVLAKPIVGTLFGDKWLDAPFFLTLCAATYLIVLFGNLSLNSLLTAVGETRLLMKLNLLSLSIGVPIGFVLVPFLGIVGVIVGNFIAVVPGVFIGLYLVWKRYGLSIDLHASSRILLVSLIAALATYLLISLLNVTYWLQLASGVLLFLSVFLFCAPLLGATTLSDLNNLRAMMSSWGILFKLLQIPLALMEKSLNIRNGLAAKQNQ